MASDTNDRETVQNDRWYSYDRLHFRPDIFPLSLLDSFFNDRSRDITAIVFATATRSRPVISYLTASNESGRLEKERHAIVVAFSNRRNVARASKALVSQICRLFYGSKEFEATVESSFGVVEAL